MRLFLALVITLVLMAAAHAQPSEKMEVINLEETNVLIFDQDISPETGIMFSLAAVVTRQSLPPEQTLYILIKSNGGAVEIAHRMSDTLNALPNTKLVCVQCASAAAMVFEKSNQERLVVPTSKMLMHEAMIIVRPSTVDKMDVKSFKRQAREFNKPFADRMGISMAEYEKLIEGRNWIVSAPEMMQRKLADRMVILTCDAAVTIAMPEACAIP